MVTTNAPMYGIRTEKPTAPPAAANSSARRARTPARWRPYHDHLQHFAADIVGDLLILSFHTCPASPRLRGSTRRTASASALCLSAGRRPSMAPAPEDGYGQQTDQRGEGNFHHRIAMVSIRLRIFSAIASIMPASLTPDSGAATWRQSQKAY